MERQVAGDVEISGGGGVLTKDVEVYLNPYPLFLRPLLLGPLNLKHRLTRRPLVVIATLLVALTPWAPEPCQEQTTSFALGE